MPTTAGPARRPTRLRPISMLATTPTSTRTIPASPLLIDYPMRSSNSTSDRHPPGDIASLAFLFRGTARDLVC